MGSGSKKTPTYSTEAAISPAIEAAPAADVLLAGEIGQSIEAIEAGAYGHDSEGVAKFAGDVMHGGPPPPRRSPGRRASGDRAHPGIHSSVRVHEGRGRFSPRRVAAPAVLRRVEGRDPAGRPEAVPRARRQKLGPRQGSGARPVP